jgi:hypothetical protein
MHASVLHNQPLHTHQHASHPDRDHSNASVAANCCQQLLQPAMAVDAVVLNITMLPSGHTLSDSAGRTSEILVRLKQGIPRIAYPVDHHHHVTQSSHSINAIGPAPLWSGRKREHCSIMFATITHIPSLHKLLSNTPRNHPAPPPTTPNIIRHKTQQLGRSINLVDSIKMAEPSLSSMHHSAFNPRSTLNP